MAQAIRSGAVAAALTLAFNLLILPFVLDRLGADLYGAWIALSALVAVGSLADAGIGTEIARRVAAAHGAADRAGFMRVVHVGTSAMLLMVTPVAVGAIVGAPLLARLVLPDGVTGYSTTQVETVIRLLALVMAANLVLGAHFATLRGLQRSDLQALSQVSALPPYGLALLVGILAGWGLWSLLVAQVVTSVVVGAMQWRALRRLAPDLRLRFPRAPLPVLASYLSLSVLALLSQLGDVVDSQWDKLVISHFIDPTSVTAFHVGTMVVLQAKVLALLPLTPLLAGISELRVRRSDEALGLQRRLMKAAGATSAVVLGGVYAFTPAFLELWLGAGYEQAGTIARIFTIAVALNVVSAPLAIQAFGEQRHHVAAASAFANMAVNVVASLVLTVQIGLYGAVLGSVIGNLSGTVVLIVLSRRHLAAWVRPPWAAPLVAVVAVALVVLTGLDAAQSWLSLVGVGAGFVVVTSACAARAEGIGVADVRTVLRPGPG
ncbi:lipopolysaccharide biosynthesis protein [Phycicoccus flavus]|uniref:Oligosaccharide flippase family protein n=1 Tax=Phycicoccus flavus TaxID=2502783 RepID=A0A8T6R5K6_9MICO|nr:oligosaccharide flippase family protein [Phycicoccus flavus]NHA69156.1 oligosaccharide flippase family protein [Phycicoccus flavus]